MTSSLDALKQSTDAYVCLFVVRSSLHGLGWGKKLMDNYARKAAMYGCPRLYLWTDKGCNYRFYDHSGFKRIGAISSPLLTDPGAEANGFIYVKDIA